MAGKNLFNVVKMFKPRANQFDLSHDVKLSCNMGELVPVMCTEAVPGDKFNIKSEALVRFAPMVAPVMHRMDVSIHYFFIPNRLLWAGWEKFITGQEELTFPYLEVGNGGLAYTRLMDYLGVPNPGAVLQSEQISALPFAAYQMLWNEYYRDQNLQQDYDIALMDGNNNANTDLVDLRNRCWEHDYFTAALPFAQKGAGVDIPLGDVTLKNDWGSLPDSPVFRNTAGDVTAGGPYPVEQQGLTADTGQVLTGADVTAYDPEGTLQVQPTTINDLRRAFKLQEWLEKNARGGTRYIESILAHFGVRSSDARLQRPEYITGVKAPVQVSEVLNTTGDAGTGLPQGNMAGHGIAVVNGNKGFYRCEEHGYVLGIMSIMPKTAYYQGLPKHFLKRDKFDFFWPEFAHIGEQPVQNREVYAFQGLAAGDATFGYVPRYAEYKFEQNRVAGDFRGGTLNFWHMARDFASPPSLNSAFVEADPTHRIFAVTDPDEQKMYCQVYNNIRAIRPMPKFGTPTF